MRKAHPVWTAATPPPEITFTSWTGPYMRSQMLGFVRPYETETRYSRSMSNTTMAVSSEIRDQVESANVKWDVVDLTQADSLQSLQGRAVGGFVGHVAARGRGRYPGQG